MRKLVCEQYSPCLYRAGRKRNDRACHQLRDDIFEVLSMIPKLSSSPSLLCYLCTQYNTPLLVTISYDDRLYRFPIAAPSYILSTLKA